jgi:hypothetical protein
MHKQGNNTNNKPIACKTNKRENSNHSLFKSLKVHKNWREEDGE